MKVADILKNKDRGVSFEFFPPKSEAAKGRLRSTLTGLKDYNPLYVSMTCGAGGISKQDETSNAVSVLLEEKDLVVMPHFTCIGMQINTTKDLLDKYKEKGIENIMVLRGDLPQEPTDFDFSQQDFRYARNLVEFIKKYGHFCIGVAVYPEGHIETKSLDEDLEYAKQKIDAGADFAVTQMFFDNIYFYGLLERMKKAGIGIPVLPGILPLTDISKVKEFASICRATVPKDIEEALGNYKDNPKDMEKAGIDFTIKQCRNLIENGAKRLHFFTLNKLSTIKTILDAIR